LPTPAFLLAFIVSWVQNACRIMKSAAPGTVRKPCYVDQAQPTRRRRNPTVLVVDDVQGMREMLRGVLTIIARCRVIMAETSNGGLALAKKDQVDVVISDLNRPGVTGFQFLRLFKQAHPNIPVIIFSGSVFGARKRRAHRLGAFRCLAKPGSADAIIKAVGEALGAGWLGKVRRAANRR